MKRQAAIFFLALVLMLGAFAGCKNTSSETPRNTTPPATDDSDSYGDRLPKLDFNNREVFMVCRGSDLWLDEMKGDTGGTSVSQAVVKRNNAVQDRLNISLNITAGNPDSTQYHRELYSLYLSESFPYDIVAGIQYETASYINKDMFRNLASAPYLDLDQPWWNARYMQNSRLGDATFMLSGDISLVMTAFTSCMFVNVRMYQDLYQKNASDIYAMVDGNQWTYETMMQMCADAFREKDQIEGCTKGDIVGISLFPGTPMDHFGMTAGLTFSKRNAKGEPELALNNEHTLNFESKLKQLCLNTSGVWFYSYHSVTEEERNKFTKGESLFEAGFLHNALTAGYQDMADTYTIIPYPKLASSQETYLSATHDNISVYCVQKGLSGERLSMACATMEAMCSYNYRHIFPLMYEEMLKTRYIRDEESPDDASRMIDLIHNNTVTDILYIYNYSLDRIGTIFRTVMENNSSFTDEYKKIEASAEAKLKNILKKYGEITDITFD